MSRESGSDSEVVSCFKHEVPERGAKILDAGRFGVGVFRQGDQYYALGNYCPHQGAPVCVGTVTGVAVSRNNYSVGWERDGEILRCPWHAWEFDIATGRSLTVPGRRVRVYQTYVDGDRVVVQLRKARAE